MSAVPVVERIKEIIASGAETELSLPDIAKRVGISVYYMSHIFKKSTGMTVVEYRTCCRLEKAKHELRHTDKSVTEIERFAKMCGMSPTRYRAENK